MVYKKNFTIDTVDLNYLDVPLQSLALPKRIRRYQSSQQSIPKSIISKLESIGSDEFAELYKTSVTSSVEEKVHNLCECMEHVLVVRCVYFYMKCFTENFILQKVDKKYYPKFFYLIEHHFLIKEYLKSSHKMCRNLFELRWSLKEDVYVQVFLYIYIESFVNVMFDNYSIFLSETLHCVAKYYWNIFNEFFFDSKMNVKTLEKVFYQDRMLITKFAVYLPKIT
ncbi:hypothetical protein EIN_217950 [Entamoeba invadens IP1]|uniref:Uncharacterized protein n=1 Tax=Entamoeba invadens IP1 TaxID=370355 RepID=L7FQS9_ENTIV|nr:hypothetical protein EIN_217950 [Entamoeba invadens IP1]ELP95330.1 hypothetical protein EIN_217950 [Entamoeba invadens IP1]|eukprot:XP_004262101.1 hypothetical protein EIN_217950 [Entamoeba invadens IP1]